MKNKEFKTFSCGWKRFPLRIGRNCCNKIFLVSDPSTKKPHSARNRVWGSSPLLHVPRAPTPRGLTMNPVCSLVCILSLKLTVNGMYSVHQRMTRLIFSFCPVTVLDEVFVAAPDTCTTRCSTSNNRHLSEWPGSMESIPRSNFFFDYFASLIVCFVVETGRVTTILDTAKETSKSCFFHVREQ